MKKTSAASSAAAPSSQPAPAVSRTQLPSPAHRIEERHCAPREHRAVTHRTAKMNVTAVHTSVGLPSTRYGL